VLNFLKYLAHFRSQICHTSASGFVFYILFLAQQSSNTNISVPKADQFTQLLLNSPIAI